MGQVDHVDVLGLGPIEGAGRCLRATQFSRKISECRQFRHCRLALDEKGPGLRSPAQAVSKRDVVVDFVAGERLALECRAVLRLALDQLGGAALGRVMFDHLAVKQRPA